jgi:5-methyltetrahydropteroyltriglutamate--homocysteine methyltransferase
MPTFEGVFKRVIIQVVAHKPPGMTLAMHLCRGNFRSTHAAAGNYEPVAEALLSEMKLDADFMEYDDERSGDFRPLRYLPKGKIAIAMPQPPSSRPSARAHVRTRACCC